MKCTVCWYTAGSGVWAGVWLHCQFLSYVSIGCAVERAGGRDIRSSVVYVPVQNKACLYHVDPLNRICILRI